MSAKRKYCYNITVACCVIYSSLLVLHSSLAFSQTRTIDSLKRVLKTEKEDTNRVNTLNVLSDALAKASSNDSSIAYANKALVLAESMSYKRGLAQANYHLGNGYDAAGNFAKAINYYLKALNLNKEAGSKLLEGDILGDLGGAYDDKGDFSEAMDYDQKALKLEEEIGNKQGEATILGDIGLIYDEQSDYPKAIDYDLKSLKMQEDLKDKPGQANNLGNIGNVYGEEGEYAIALTYYNKVLKLASDMGNTLLQAGTLGNIGIMYEQQKDFFKAMDCFLKAQKIDVKIGNIQGEAIDLANIGLVYGIRHDFAKALDYNQRALKMEEEMGNKLGIAVNLAGMGSLFTQTGKFKEAEECLQKAIAMADSMGDLDNLRQFEDKLSELYDTTGRSKLALTWYKKSIALKDTLFNINKDKALTRKELTYEFDKKQAAQKAEQDKKDALAEADKRKQTIIIWSTIGGLLLVLVFAGFIFRSLRITRKQKDIIEIKNKETEEQKKIIEEKNRDIIDSINYAKRLQDAILPSLSTIKQHLPESFVLYKPKDIVAGDFYWLEAASPPSKGEVAPSSPKGGINTNSSEISPLGSGGAGTILIAAADCTGHGVPGALVSVVCSNALNRTVKEFKITEPGKILDKVRELVLETFEKSESNVQDGMDISLVAISYQPLANSYSVQWSGANNSLWYIQSGELKEIAPDKQPIGKYDKAKPFTTHSFTIPISPLGSGGAVLYLFTDGYADQFGGSKGKKFKYKQMEEKLVAISHQSMAEQKNILEQTFDEWKGGLEQVDDVLVIGIRV